MTGSSSDSGSRLEVTGSGPPFPRSAELAGERLVSIGGVDVDELAREHGTPLYVLDRAELEARMSAYRDAFGPEVIVAYAAKALCVTGVLQLVAEAGLFVDVASAGELATARNAGFDMARVYFHGNNKSTAELELAAELGVGRIVVDSAEELERVADAAQAAERRLAVLLRVTPGVGAGAHAFIRTGQDDSKFGFTLSSGAADQAMDTALASPHLDVRGVHCHVGSQVIAGAAYTEATEAMVGFLAGVAQRHGESLAELNLGGGLGIAYSRGEADPSVQDYADALLSTVRAACERHGLAVPRLTVEPGRSIVGPAGVTLYEVGTVKRVAGVRTFVAVDGGMSDNLRPALYGARYTFVPAGRSEGAPPPRGLVTVVGKHCETGDVLGHDVDLPEIAAGELLAVAATGAYGYAMASNYNRLPRPAMVLVGDGAVDLLVRRETLADVLSHDVPLP